LANAIAKAYQSYRWDVRKNLSLGGIKALEERLAEHDAKVHAAEPMSTASANNTISLMPW